MLKCVLNLLRRRKGAGHRCALLASFVFTLGHDLLSCEYHNLVKFNTNLRLFYVTILV